MDLDIDDASRYNKTNELLFNISKVPTQGFMTAILAYAKLNRQWGISGYLILSAFCLLVSCGLHQPTRFSTEKSPSLPQSTIAQKQASQIQAQKRADIQLVRTLLYQNARYLRPDQIETLAPKIIDWANEADFPPLVVLALIKVESGFQPLAVSYAGAYGLTQLLPYVARAETKLMRLDWDIHLDPAPVYERLQQHQKTAEVSLFDPAVNIRIGIHYLKRLKERFNSPQHYFAAYNMGPTLLDSRLKQGIEPKGEYYKKITTALLKLESQRQAYLARRNGWQRAISPLPSTQSQQALRQTRHHSIIR